MADLKACPFCGGMATLQSASPQDNYFIKCRNCAAETMKYFRTPQEARAAWNRRAEPENMPLTMEQLRKMGGEPVWIALLNIAKQPKCEIITEVHEDGICMVCANDDDDYATFDLYSKTWLAYRHKPEEDKP